MSQRTTNASRMIQLTLAALAGLALAACPSKAPEPAAPVEPVEDEPVEESAATVPAQGEYTCRVTIGGEEQPERPCTVGEGDLPDTLWLEIVEGDVQIFGEVTPVDATSFEFAGEVLCPQGACDEPLDATFQETVPGAYEARADTEGGEVVIEMSR